MIFLVVAQPPDEYEAWAAHEREPAAEPHGEEATQGEQCFYQRPVPFATQFVAVEQPEEWRQI